MAHITPPPTPSGTYVPSAATPLGFMRAGEDTYPAAVTTAQIAFGNGDLRVAPIYVPRTITAVRLSTYIAAGGTAGAVVRLGIWNDDGTGKPSTLVLDAGTVAATAVGIAVAATNQILQPGLYWVGAAPQGAPATTPTLVYASNLAQQQSGPSGSTPLVSNCWGAAVTGAFGSLAAATRNTNPALVSIGI